VTLKTALQTSAQIYTNKFFCGFFLHAAAVLAASVSAGLIVPRAQADFEDLPHTPHGAEKPAVGNTQTAPVVTPDSTRPPSSGSGASASGKDTGATVGGSVKSSQGKNSSANKNSSSAASAPQSDEGDMEHNSGAPVSYSAQSLEGSLTKGRILLKGDVEIEQADAIMKSDVAEIFSSKDTSTPQRALAKGRVSLKKAATATAQELRAVANELEYFIPKRKVILKGKPKIWRGRELLQGEVIEVFLDTNEIKVRGARGVMEPPAASPAAAGNSTASGVQNAPAKKSSQTGRK
jgi:lipopolysaccharide transport protein LptA